MSTSRLQSAIQQYRQQLAQREQKAVQALEAGYRHTLTNLQPALDRMYRQIADKQKAGETIPPSWLYEERRLETIKQLIENQVTHFAALSQMTVGQLQHAAAQMGQQGAQALLHASVPPGVNWTFGVPSTAAIANLVGATQKGSPLYDLFHGFGAEAAKGAGEALILGLSLGYNPRQIAGEVQQALQVPRWRALTIARTEMLRSYRGANIATYQANSDVVGQWRWTSEKSARTCAACIAMDGEVFDVSEDMGSHANCRCVPLPVTKSWDDILGPLGIDTSDIPDTSPIDDMQSGSDWFSSQDQTTQQQILGPAKYLAWTNGLFDFSQIVGHSHSDEWGPSIYEKSLKQLTAEASHEEKAASQTVSSLQAPTLTKEDESRLHELEQQLHQKYPQCAFDFSGSDPTLMERVAKQIDTLFSQYPSVAATIPYIGTGKNAPKGYELYKKGGNMETLATATSGHQGNQAYSPIILNPKFLGNPDLLQAAYDLSEKKDWLTPNGYSFEATLTHEFGHALRFYLTHNGTGQYVGDDEVASLIDRFMNENAQLGEKVSGYAKAGGADEQFAEAFASLHFSEEGDQADYTKKLGELLDKLLPGGIPAWENIAVDSKEFSAAFANAHLFEFGSGDTFRFTLGGKDYFAKKAETDDIKKELLARELAVEDGLEERTIASQQVERDGETYLVQEWISNGKPLSEADKSKWDGVFGSMSADDLTRMQLHEYFLSDGNRNAGNYYVDKTRGKLLEIDFDHMGSGSVKLDKSSLLTDYLIRHGAELSPAIIRSYSKELEAMYKRIEHSGAFSEAELARFRARMAVVRELSKGKHPTIDDLQQLAEKTGQGAQPTGEKVIDAQGVKHVDLTYAGIHQWNQQNPLFAETESSTS